MSVRRFRRDRVVFCCIEILAHFEIKNNSSHDKIFPVELTVDSSADTPASYEGSSGGVSLPLLSGKNNGANGQTLATRPARKISQAAAACGGPLGVG